MLPALRRRERQDRGHEVHEDFENAVECRLGRAPRARPRRLAIEAVLHDVEIERAQVHAAEVVERMINDMELELIVRVEAAREQRVGAAENPPVALLELFELGSAPDRT